MTLLSLIRKRDTVGIATAIPAISATRKAAGGETVARIAGIAVATPREEHTAAAAKVVADDSATAFRWLFYFVGRDPLEAVFVSAVNHDGALACYPDAVAAVPQAEHPCRAPTAIEAQEISALIQAIYADDNYRDRNEALAAALADPDRALLCYRTIAGERAIALPDADDDRRYCTQCLKLRGRVCAIAKPGGLVSARLGYQPIQDVLHRCAGYLPNATDTDQRNGRERWPELANSIGDQ